MQVFPLSLPFVFLEAGLCVAQASLELLDSPVLGTQACATVPGFSPHQVQEALQNRFTGFESLQPASWL
jgi:hypothetical protein